MRILLLNPNTTEALTRRLGEAARQVLPAEVTLDRATAPTGFPYISSRAEAQIAGGTLLAMLAERRGTFDAAVIAAFGDPGLRAARELFDVPVTGMTEASMLTACALGDRFAFVTFSPRLAPWYREQVTRARLEARFAGIFTRDVPLGRIDAVAKDQREILRDLCRLAAEEADVLILAGAPIAGLAAEIRAEVPAILLDPVQAAVLQAVSLARLAPGGSNAGSFARPPAKPSTGLPPALDAWIGRTGD
jgi:Asp/Glu/hydantoin racemase